MELRSTLALAPPSPAVLVRGGEPLPALYLEVPWCDGCCFGASPQFRQNASKSWARAGTLKPHERLQGPADLFGYR